MKKNLVTRTLLIAAAMVAAAACQREAAIQDNPNYNSETKEVTAQFVLNVTAAPTTKMSADAVQQNHNFRGIQDAQLFAYKTEMAPSQTPYVLTTSQAPAKSFDMSLFMANGSLNNAEGKNDAESSRRVMQLSIPVGVDAVMFYGKAIKAAAATDAEYGATGTAAEGTVISGTPSQTRIAAKKILNDSNVSAYDQTAALMIFVINNLLSIGVEEDDNSSFGTLPAVTWAQYGHQYEYDHYGSTSRYGEDKGLGHAVEGLEEVLGKCYYQFTYITPSDIEAPIGSDDWYAALGTSVRPTGEYRAGSSGAIRAMVMDMYKVITAASSATPTNAEEANAKRLAELILDRADLYFYKDDGTGDETYKKGDYKPTATIKALLKTYSLVTDAEWANKYAKAVDDLNGYPFSSFGVPVGAAQLGFHYDGENNGAYTKDEFYYQHPNRPLVNPTMPSFDPKKYLYPAELWYYVNSPVRTTLNDVSFDSYPNGVTPWNTTASWNGWDSPGKVEGSTRGVAVTNSINYGVALLKSSVVYSSGVTELLDNRYELTNHAEANKTINVTAAQLELRGVLIGGVNPRMNWQFIRKYETTGDHEGKGDLSLFDGVIYDHSLPSNAVPTPADSPNYTLVYDNYNSSSEVGNQNDVYVSLEFVNKGEAFYGRDNMIPNEGIFYLVAKLEKPTADQGNALPWPTDHQIPPIWGVDGGTVTSPAVAGESKKIARVFIQDFMTTAVFKIGTTSLQKAYYSIPDLRASQMSLGLSVDLQWTPGLTYEKEL